MRITHRLFAASVPVLLAAQTPPAMADAFYCGPDTIHEGMPSAEIEQKCGRPDRVKVTEEPVFAKLANGATVQTGVETTYVWYFDRGPNQFVAEVTVRDETAKRIRLLNTRNIDDLPDE